MELLSGFPLFLQQFQALTKKNAILTWRNKRSAFIQLFSPLLFIFLLFCIDKAVRSRFSGATTYDRRSDPPTRFSPAMPIPPCEDKFYVKSPCYDFVWSGSGSARVSGIVAAIMRNNPGRPIAEERVRVSDFKLFG